MKNYEEISAFMRESIEKSARKDLDVIENEIHEQEHVLLERVKIEAQKEIDTEYNLKMQNMKTKNAQMMASVKKESDQAMIRRRNELFEEMYAQLDAQLETYVQSDAYVQNELEKAKVFFTKYNDPNVVFIVKAKDEKLIAALQKAFANAQIKESNEMRLGGMFIQLLSSNQQFDFSLDTALDEAKSGFVKEVNFQLEG